MSDDIRTEAKAMIAQVLGEKEAAPIEQIGRIIDCVGPDKTIEIVKLARQEHKLGAMTLDGTRSRTLGGVFFRLAHQYLNAQQRHIVWPERAERRKAKQQEKQQEREVIQG